MGAQKLRHEALLMEWREKVAECRGSSSGNTFSLEMEPGVVVARLHTKTGLVDICAGADKGTLQNLLWVLKDAE